MSSRHSLQAGRPPQHEPSELLSRGRAHFERHDWRDAFEALMLADRSHPLGAEDLQRLAWSAGMAGRDEEMLAAQERVHRAWLELGEELAASRAAFWLGFRLLARGEYGRAGGWLSRAQRLVDLHAEECVEQGYLLLPAAQRHLSAGEHAKAVDCASRAVSIGERFGEADLIAFGRNLHGRALLSDGQIEPGLAHLDEAMLAATTGELSPAVTGIVYCTAIAACDRIFALDRVREWTSALSKWCDDHPQLGMFTGHCLVHRAEVMELRGAWPEAVEEARRAAERCVRDIERTAAGRAHYQQGEIHRLQGQFPLAESAYREASRFGHEPQPGLALLRLAQGEPEAAATTSRRIIGAAPDRWARTRLLPAHVEIMLAVGDVAEARKARDELQETAALIGTEVLAAIAQHAAGMLHLAEGNPHAALAPVRSAFSVWQRLGARYLEARLRVLLARACAAAGDLEAASLELGCAREVFEELGAKPDLAAIATLDRPSDQGQGRYAGVAHPLTERELQVLRLIAGGNTNKMIARELSLSEKTIDRHASNIFGKLGVSSRAGATASAYERKLI
jgi:DNA-binding CsgD family transcriptional regulator